MCLLLSLSVLITPIERISLLQFCSSSVWPICSLLHWNVQQKKRGGVLETGRTELDGSRVGRTKREGL